MTDTCDFNPKHSSQREQRYSIRTNIDGFYDRAAKIRTELQLVGEILVQAPVIHRFKRCPTTYEHFHI